MNNYLIESDEEKVRILGIGKLNVNRTFQVNLIFPTEILAAKFINSTNIKSSIKYSGDVVDSATVVNVNTLENNSDNVISVLIYCPIFSLIYDSEEDIYTGVVAIGGVVVNYEIIIFKKKDVIPNLSARLTLLGQTATSITKKIIVD